MRWFKSTLCSTLSLKVSSSSDLMWSLATHHGKYILENLIQPWTPLWFMFSNHIIWKLSPVCLVAGLCTVKHIIICVWYRCLILYWNIKANILIFRFRFSMYFSMVTAEIQKNFHHVDLSVVLTVLQTVGVAVWRRKLILFDLMSKQLKNDSQLGPPSLLFCRLCEEFWKYFYQCILTVGGKET